jgi:hypothetical protein
VKSNISPFDVGKNITLGTTKLQEHQGELVTFDVFKFCFKLVCLLIEFKFWSFKNVVCIPCWCSLFEFMFWEASNASTFATILVDLGERSNKENEVPNNTCLQLINSSKSTPMICSQHLNIPPNFHDQVLDF